MIDDILLSAANLMTGGGAGVGLSLITKGFGAFLRNRKERLNHKFRLEMAEAMGKLNLEMTKEGSLQTAIEADAKAGEGVSQWVRDLRGIFRPALTTLLCMGYIGYVFLIQTPPPVVYEKLTGLAVGFWFGDRSVDKA